MNGFPHAAIRVRRIKEPVVQTRRGPAVEPRHQRLASLGLVLLILGAAATAQAAAPTANAGGNQTVNEQTTVNLDGTGSTDDGIITTYAWTQVGGPNVTLTGAGTATPSFTAPTVLVADSPLLLTFQLQVTDDELLTSTDTVQITVNAVNAVPVANAGTDQGVNEGTTVNLNGNGSRTGQLPTTSGRRPVALPLPVFQDRRPAPARPSLHRPCWLRTAQPF